MSQSSAHGVRLVEVGPEEAGQRVDNFLLKHLKGVPKGHVYRLLRTGQVRVNKGRAKPTRRLEAGDQVRLPPVRQTDTAAPGKLSPGLAEVLSRAILFEDERLLVVNKPAGLAVHGGSGMSLGLIEALRQLRPDAPYLELVHRLDRETSGCLLIAKRRSMLRSLHELLREGSVDKTYLALVDGVWDGPGELRTGLRKNQVRGGERVVNVTEDGKESVTRFRVQHHLAAASLLEVDILTGRTHQIRVHAAHAGHPVAGDEKYGDREANKRFRKQGLKRMFLHAWRLGFVHPLSGEPVRFEAPLDAELEAVLDRLAVEV